MIEIFNPLFKVLKYIKPVKNLDFSTVPQILIDLSYLGQRLKIVSLHNILFESILTLGAKISKAAFRGSFLFRILGFSWSDNQNLKIYRFSMTFEVFNKKG